MGNGRIHDCRFRGCERKEELHHNNYEGQDEDGGVDKGTENIHQNLHLYRRNQEGRQMDEKTQV